MNLENNADWLAASVENGAPFIPTFPGRSLGNMSPQERQEIIAEAAGKGLNTDRLLGLSSDGHYFITAGTAPRDLQFDIRG